MRCVLGAEDLEVLALAGLRNLAVRESSIVVGILLTGSCSCKCLTGRDKLREVGRIVAVVVTTCAAIAVLEGQLAQLLRLLRPGSSSSMCISIQRFRRRVPSSIITGSRGVVLELFAKVVLLPTTT